jgi:outer membrane protein
MKKTPLILAIIATGLVASAMSTATMAQESPWLVRGRIVDISPANGADPIGGSGASDRITVANKTIPEVDISYFFTPNWAAELILTYPQKHDVFLDGANIGSFKELPPTLNVQYHFNPEAQFSPYLGAGLNYTRISNVSLASGTIGLDNHSFGGSVQAGVDYKIDKNWSLNLDVKYVQIKTGVYAGGATISNLNVSPVLVGVGVGYRF